MKLSPYILFQKVRNGRLKRWLYYTLLNLYPPHLGAGIRTIYVAPDLRTFRLRMKLHWWNRNFVGTQFGGSLYAMCDATYMLILIEALGDSFIIWDKAATIHFRRPGRGTVHAEFRITPEQLSEIRATLATKEKYEHSFRVEIRDGAGEVVAEVDKLIYFKHKAVKTAQTRDTVTP